MNVVGYMKTLFSLLTLLLTLNIISYVIIKILNSMKYTVVNRITEGQKT